MKGLLIFVTVLSTVYSQSAISGPGSFNSLPNMLNGISTSQLVTRNCVGNGNPCSATSLPCCLSPVFKCQAVGNPNNKLCLVAPSQLSNIPQIKQALRNYGVSTVNPIL